MDIQISKEANHLLDVIFKEYKRRREAGVSIDKAINMADDIWIQKNLIPEWSLDDVTAICYVLRNNNLLFVYPADNHAYKVFLTDEGIAYAQNKPSRWLSKLQKIKDILHF